MNRRRLPMLLPLAALLLLLGRGCSDSSETTQASAGAAGASAGSVGVPAGGAAGAVVGGMAGVTSKGGASGKGGKSGASGKGGGGQGGTSGAGGCPAEKRPAGVPEDWDEFTGWSCDCRFYTPSAQSELPPPIEWEDCKPPVPSSLSCRWMKTPWQKKSTIAIAANARYSLDKKTNAPLFLLSRTTFDDYPDHEMTIAAEADGPVKMAYLKATGYFKACAIGMQHLADNKFAFRVLGDSKLEKTWEGPEGLIAGDLDDPYHPTVLKYPRTNELTPYWAVSSSAIARIYGDISGRGWDLSSFPIYSPSSDPQHLPVGDIFGFQGGFFIEATNSQWKGAILRWEPDTGLKDVLRFPGAPLRGADHFGTDGKAMVWTYGEDPNPETQGYNKLTVMTAPYSLDPDVVAKTSKALTLDPPGTNIQPFAVGCGYAARYKFQQETYHGAFIVRLSDGFSWKLSGLLPAHIFSYNRVVGITCDELFVEVSAAGVTGNTIARIRLDSLGPGTPPN